MKPKKIVGLVTTSRSEWSYLLPFVKEIKKRRFLKLNLIVTGSHFLKSHGYTYDDIEETGVKPDVKIRIPIRSNTAYDIGYCLSRYTLVFAREFGKLKPDILVLPGDRLEMLAVALASLPFNIPIVHIGGGDVTGGAIDDSIRHALTKLSHIHFVTNTTSYARVIQMGEEAWRVYRTGSLANDCIRETRLLGMEELRKRIPFLKHNAYLLVTCHPETLDTRNTAIQIKNLLDAIDIVGLPAVFTYPNVDAGNQDIIENIEAFVKSGHKAIIIRNAGVRQYYSLVKHAAALVGNSSSGIYDTPYFCVPAINVGRRQAGRTMGANVINVEGSAAKIEKAIKRGLSEDFRKGLGTEIRTFFGDGCAAVKMVNVLEQICVNDALLIKKFCLYT